jgi:hypothetical protein
MRLPQRKILIAFKRLSAPIAESGSVTRILLIVPRESWGFSEYGAYSADGEPI